MLNKKALLITALIIPSLAFAEGQDSFTLIFGFIDLLKVFIPWVIIIPFGIFLYQKQFDITLAKNKKLMIYLITGICALFIWSMIIYDSKPYEGPIDSIFYHPNGENRF